MGKEGPRPEFNPEHQRAEEGQKHLQGATIGYTNVLSAPLRIQRTPCTQLIHGRHEGRRHVPACPRRIASGAYLPDAGRKKSFQKYGRSRAGGYPSDQKCGAEAAWSVPPPGRSGHVNPHESSSSCLRSPKPSWQGWGSGFWFRSSLPFSWQSSPIVSDEIKVGKRTGITREFPGKLGR